MNSAYIEVGALMVLAFAVLIIAVRLSSTVARLLEPFHMIAESQKHAIEIQGKAVQAQLEASTALKLVTENGVTTAQRVETAVKELAATRAVYLGEANILTQNRLQLAESIESLQSLIRDFDSLQRDLGGISAAFLQPTLDRVADVEQAISKGFTSLLVRDLSYVASRYPRRIQIDFTDAELEVAMDQDKFPVHLKKVKFKLVCEAGDCDSAGHAKLSDVTYEINQKTSAIAGFVSTAAGLSRWIPLAEGLGSLDERVKDLLLDGAKAMALTITLPIFAHGLAVVAVFAVDQMFCEGLSRLAREPKSPQLRRMLFDHASKAQFVVRDIGGRAHAQLGAYLEREDTKANRPVFDGFSLRLDEIKGYQWVCDKHAQSFTDSLRRRGL